MKLAMYEFPCQQNHWTYAKSRNKEGDSTFKAKPFEIQIIICGEKNKNHSIQLPCRCKEGKRQGGWWIALSEGPAVASELTHIESQLEVSLLFLVSFQTS